MGRTGTGEIRRRARSGREDPPDPRQQDPAAGWGQRPVSPGGSGRTGVARPASPGPESPQPAHRRRKASVLTTSGVAAASSGVVASGVVTAGVAGGTAAGVATPSGVAAPGVAESRRPATTRGRTRRDHVGGRRVRLVRSAPVALQHRRTASPSAPRPVTAVRYRGSHGPPLLAPVVTPPPPVADDGRDPADSPG